MKTVLIIFTILLGSQVMYSQNVKQDIKGNFIELESPNKKIEKTSKTYTDLKGKTHEVYVTKTGKYFINVTSKTGKTYRKYLKTEV